MDGERRGRDIKMLGALAAGVALGGVIVFTLLSYLWEWGVFKEARWWDVMTAFGTVGAAIGAAVSSFLLLGSHIKERKEREFVNRLAVKYIENRARKVQWYVRQALAAMYHLPEEFKRGNLSKSIWLSLYNSTVLQGKEIAELHLPDHLLVGVDRELYAQISLTNNLLGEWKEVCKNFTVTEEVDDYSRSMVMTVISAARQIATIEKMLYQIPFEKVDFMEGVKFKDVLERLEGFL